MSNNAPRRPATSVGSTKTACAGLTRTVWLPPIGSWPLAWADSTCLLPSANVQPIDLCGYISYNACMASVVTAKVSHRGQTSLPAELRHRWGIADGGDVAFIDLGDAALVLPGGIEVAKAEVRRALAGGAYADGLAAIADTDLGL